MNTILFCYILHLFHPLPLRFPNFQKYFVFDVEQPLFLCTGCWTNDGATGRHFSLHNGEELVKERSGHTHHNIPQLFGLVVLPDVLTFLFRHDHDVSQPA